MYFTVLTAVPFSSFLIQINYSVFQKHVTRSSSGLRDVYVWIAAGLPGMSVADLFT